jgi:stage II sporulation protein D
LLAVLFAAAPLEAGSVSVSVFGLFRPQELIVSPAVGDRLNITSGGESLSVEGGQRLKLSRQGTAVNVSIGGTDSLADMVNAKPSSVAGRFVVDVPQKIRREFSGELTVRVRDGSLEAVVVMDLETAVAAIVAAEGGALPRAALEAQSVAARSYLSASVGRHSGYQFCDTTHCQYLADPPSPDSPAWLATVRTRGMVIAYRGTRFAPFYSRACGGETHTPSDIGLSGGVFPYRRVHCPVCSREENSWEANRPASDVETILSNPRSERARLEVVRRLGWSAVPSNRYKIRSEGDQVCIEGTGEGHGVGLCQRGAIGLANEGWSFREILGYYFPDSSLVELPAN